MRALLMGGQACVLYGAAEFSRDTDIAIPAEARNFARLLAAMGDLDARPIAVPPAELAFLSRGHALHFRCRHPEADGMRVDVLSRMRGVAGFEDLWARRSTIWMENGLAVDVLGLGDLVQSKKTQRDKDWPTIRRLVEADFFRAAAPADPAHLRFWLAELRTPEILVEVCRRHPAEAVEAAATRPLLHAARPGNDRELARLLAEEEGAERERDREYWAPLRRELEALRRAR